MKKYFIYCRKSSEDSSRQVQSIEDQKRVMKQIALNHSLCVERIFTDEKSAGKPAQREGFTEMITEIEKGTIDIIVTWKIDRLSRNPIENGQISWMLQRGVISKIVAADRVYLPDDNVLPFMIEGAMANQYLRDLSKNVKRGMWGKVERGIYPGMAPIGYINKRSRKYGNVIDIDPLQFYQIQKVWRRLLDRRYKLADLYRFMQENHPIYDRNDHLICFSSFHRIFRNPFYSGLFKWRSEIHPGKHPPMITQSEFYKTQRILETRSKTRKSDVLFEFKGVFTCGNCGACITAERKQKYIKSRKRYKSYDYYRCVHRKLRINCCEKPVSKLDIENQIMGYLDEVHIHKQVFDYGIAYLNNIDHSSLNLKNLTKAYLNQKRSINVKITAITDNIVLEKDPEIRAIMKTRLRELNLEIHRIDQDMNATSDELKRRTHRFKNQFESIYYAHKTIISGCEQDKLNLISAIGTNWTIKDKILSFEPTSMFQALKDNSPSSLPDEISHDRVLCIWQAICKQSNNLLDEE